MNNFLDFPLYLMETLKCWSSLYGYVVIFTFLVTESKGSACEAPSSPQCFRKNADDSVYMCEWSMNTTKSDVTFDLNFNETKFGSIKKTWYLVNEEMLIKYRPVYIWVKANMGNSSCASSRRSVVLGHTVKYEAPQNISVFWMNNNLRLSWTATEQHPASAEVWFRRDEHPTERWAKRLINTTNGPRVYQVIVVNLLKHSAYQVQIRHRSTQVKNPLWSNWSPVVTVPAELEREPEVTMTAKRLNGTRKVKITWKPMSHAEAVRGVTYMLQDTLFSHGCPCVKRKHPIQTFQNTIYTYVSYSAVNISIIARNAAGDSPPAIIQVPYEPAADLKTCDKMLLNVTELNSKSCHQWNEVQDGDVRQENVITLPRKKRKHWDQIKNKINDYVRYLYFEHRCHNRKPHTVKMCLFYQKEGAPDREPQDFIAFGETHSSANLSWTTIPLVHQRGYLTHYSLCSMKINLKNTSKECLNISASVVKYHLENLTPESKYNISLAGVTEVGEGPRATVTINTLPAKPVNVWLSLGLLFVFFFMSTLCTIILKRIKNKIFPPVPTPVIPDFIACQLESQEMLEEKEEVHELTLLQLHPEGKSVSEEAEESTVFLREWDDESDEDMENERQNSKMPGGTDDESRSSTEQDMRSCGEEEITDLEVDNEIAMLIYKNGLVFDVKTDST